MQLVLLSRAVDTKAEQMKDGLGKPTEGSFGFVRWFGGYHFPGERLRTWNNPFTVRTPGPT